MVSKSDVPLGVGNHKTKVIRVVMTFIAIVFWGLLIYSNTFTVPFYFDDYFTIVENPLIKNIKSLMPLWKFDPSRFLTHLSFALNFYLHGVELWGYHGVNLLLHLSITCLYYHFLNLILTKTDFAKRDDHFPIRWVIFFASWIFLCHPLQTQSVTYISQRSTLLASFFYLLTLIFYIHFRLSGKAHFYYLGFSANILGLFTKPIIVTLPLAMILVEIFSFGFLKKKNRRGLMEILPYGLIAIIVPFLLMLWRYKFVEFDFLSEITKETFKIGRYEYLLTQFNVFMTYLRLLFIPVNQSLDYDYPIAHSLLSLPTFFSFLMVCLFSISAFLLFKKEKGISFGMFWMGLTLSVESSVFPISDVINEHRLYLPMVGFALMMAFLFKRLLKTHRIYLYVMCLIVFIFSGLTYKRNEAWGNIKGFHEQMIHRFPKKARLHNNLGNIYCLFQKDYPAAEKAYLKAIELDSHYCFAYNNLANIYMQQKRIEEAIQTFQKAIEADPQFAGSYFNLGNLYCLYFPKKMNEAAKYFLKALEINPYYVAAMLGLGQIYLNMGDGTRAKFYFDLAGNIEPSNSLVYQCLGNLYVQTRKFDLAIHSYEEALRRNPRLPVVHNNLGNIYDILGDVSRAIKEYERAISLDPQFAGAYFNLAKILRKTGDQTRAEGYESRYKQLLEGQ